MTSRNRQNPNAAQGKQKKLLSPAGLVNVVDTGADALPDSDMDSPETHIGCERMDSFVSPGGVRQDVSHAYSVPKHLELNQ
jgi:hypothetical protein